MQGLRRDHGKRREAGVETSACLLFLGPSQERRRCDIILARSCQFRARDEGALGRQLRLLGFPVVAIGTLPRLPCPSLSLGCRPAISRSGSCDALPFSSLEACRSHNRQMSAHMRGEIVQSGCSHRVVIATCADASAKGMLRVGRYVDRIVGRRAERDRCSALGACEGAPGVTENTRHNAIADRRLIVPSLGRRSHRETREDWPAWPLRARRPTAPREHGRSARGVRGTPRSTARTLVRSGARGALQPALHQRPKRPRMARH